MYTILAGQKHLQMLLTLIIFVALYPGHQQSETLLSCATALYYTPLSILTCTHVKS